MKIVGYRHVTGEYNNQHYDNYRVFCIDPSDKNNVGICPQLVKVKSTIISQMYEDPTKMINDNVEFYYDAFGNVKAIVRQQ